MRYDTFSQNCARDLRNSKINEEKKGNLVFLGQHLDDQLETVYMRIEKHSGFLGLAGMSTISNGYCRPLLNFSKQEIIDEATLNGWNWFEDPSNQDITFTRNNIRQKLANNKSLRLAVSNIQQNAALWRKEFNTAMAAWCKKHINKHETIFSKQSIVSIVDELSPSFVKLQNKTLESFSLLSTTPEISPEIYIGATALQYIIHHISSFKKERLQKYRLAYQYLLNNRNFTVSQHLVVIKKGLVFVKKEQLR